MRVRGETTLGARARDTPTADISEGRKNSEGPSRFPTPEAMFDQLVTTGRERKRVDILLPIAPVNILGLPSSSWTYLDADSRNTGRNSPIRRR